MDESQAYESFGSWVRRRRKLLDLTQAGLGERAGCSAAAIRKIEADERKPSRQLAGLLADALQISTEEREIFLLQARGIHIDVLPHSTESGSKLVLDWNLPHPMTALVDRIRDAAAVTGMLSDPAVRWVTLIGPPGIGKTRLSLQSGQQVAPHFPDGAWFVDLAPLGEPGEVIPAVARVLAPLGMPLTPTLDQMIGILRKRTCLLILDNFEHITEAALEITGLVKQCPGIKVLATSRLPLHLYAEFEYRVPPLSIPPTGAADQPGSLLQYEAVQLFLLRLRQHQPAFQVNEENASYIVQICTRLEGIPLALELAAASLKRISLLEMVQLLGNLEAGGWIRAISTSARDLPARQQTLENLVAWSYTRLDPEVQTLFRRLAVFTEWFDTEEAAEICCFDASKTTSRVQEILDFLADQSLLEHRSMANRSTWKLLGIIREFAALQIPAKEQESLEICKADFLLGQLRSLSVQSNPEERSLFFQTHFHDLHASLRWVISREMAGRAYELADYLNSYWWNHGYLREGLEMVRRLLDLPSEVSAETRINWLENASDLAWQQQDFSSALRFASDALELAKQQGLMDRFPQYVNRLGRIHLEMGDFLRARQALAECLQLARQNPASFNPGIVLTQLGELALFESQVGQAKALFGDAVQLLTAENQIFLSMCWIDRAEIALAEGQVEEAHHLLRHAFTLSGSHIRRTMIFLLAVVGTLLAKKDRGKQDLQIAGQILGAVDGLANRSGIILNPFYLQLIQQRSTALIS